MTTLERNYIYKMQDVGFPLHIIFDKISFTRYLLKGEKVQTIFQNKLITKEFTGAQAGGTMHYSVLILSSGKHATIRF